MAHMRRHTATAEDLPTVTAACPTNSLNMPSKPCLLSQRQSLSRFLSCKAFVFSLLVYVIVSDAIHSSDPSCMQRTLFSAAAAMSTSQSTKKAGAIIFLHGLGDTPAGWSELEEWLPSMRPRLSQLEYVFPAAPIISISINGGARMPGWFDLYDWPIEVGAKDDPKGLQAGVDVVEQHVKELNAKGIPSDKIVVGGFSQGGAIALLAAYQSKTTTYAGCVGLSAWLTMPEKLQVSEAAKKTPLYWGHGTFDDKVVFQQQAFGVGKLREQGVEIKDESFSMGHSSHPKEMESFAEFVDQRIFGKEQTGAGSSEL